MKKEILVFVLFWLALQISSKGQDPQFTQAYFNPLYLAPSFAGSEESLRASMNYRNQWPAMSGNISTTTMGLDMNISSFNSGLGLLIMDDRIGTVEYAHRNVGLLYAYNITLSRKFNFRPGLGIYYGMRSMDPTKMVFSSELYEGGNLTESIEIENQDYIDASASGLFYSDDFWVGFTADHLTQPNVGLTYSENKLPVKLSFFGGYKFKINQVSYMNRNESINLAFLYKQQSHSQQFDVGAYWKKSPFIVGVWYRDLPFLDDLQNQDAVSLLGGYSFNNLRVAYSYDITISKLRSVSGGAHEMSLIYKFNFPPRDKIRAIPCPNF